MKTALTLLALCCLWTLTVRLVDPEGWRRRVLLALIALDVFLFAVACLGNVRRGECASSAAWDCRLSGKWQGAVFVPLIDALFWLDPSHCHRSWLDQQSLYQQ